MIHPGSRALNRNTLARRLVHGWTGKAGQLILPPRLKIMVQYYYRLGHFPNLRNPRTFNEKIQYRKLHDRNPRYAPLIDKIQVKSFVASTIGPEWVISTLWSGANPAEIPFDTLVPPYVVKASHTSNCNYFVRTTEDVDPARIRGQAARWLKIDHARIAHEWAYSQVEPRLLVEPYVGDTAVLPVDLKFFVFHGVVHFIEVGLGRGAGKLRWVSFDRDWNWYPGYDNGELDEIDKHIPAPKHLTTMIDAAETLAAEFDFARVDFYEVDGRPLFGEITFYPDAGYDHEHLPEYERRLGDLWHV